MNHPFQAASHTVIGVALVFAITGVPVLPVSAATHETIPTLTVGHQTFTNAVVVRATSGGLVIRHATGGATVPLADLPDSVREEYALGEMQQPSKPEVDPGAAADLARRQREYTEDARRSFFRTQETTLERQLSGLRDERGRLNQVLPVLHNRAKGTRRNSPQRAELNRAQERKIAVINRIAALEADLDRVRERLLGLR